MASLTQSTIKPYKGYIATELPDGWKAIALEKIRISLEAQAEQIGDEKEPIDMPGEDSDELLPAYLASKEPMIITELGEGANHYRIGCKIVPTIHARVTELEYKGVTSYLLRESEVLCELA